MGAPLTAWPWNNLKIFKYVLYGPLVAQCFKYRVFGGSEAEKWCFYILLLCFLRGTVYQAGYMISTLMSFWKKYRIQREGVDFKQVDREWEWDNFILLQGVLATAACLLVPSLSSLPVFNYKGLICILLIHMGISEPLYYLMHRLFHTEFFFRNYHSLHHSSVVTTPQTAGTATFLEHLILSGIIGIPLTVASRLGVLSISMTYAYLLGFDFFRCLGHLNVEVVPLSLFKFMPFLRYLFYTPSYHSLHHTYMDSNYCLFMPLYDYLGKTLNKKSWHLHKKIRTEKETTVADFVFLAHSVDVHSSVHVPFVFRWLSAHPFRTTPLSLAFWPISFTIMLMIWAWGKTFTIRFYRLRDRLHETWCVPRYGFQYFLPFSLDGINSHIEDAILTADELGVKVISLAALNKNEALNGGGTLFVQKHPNLRVRVVHGNTLTAAVIINEIPKDVKEVFLTGATSKLGRAIALHLCKRGVRVLMLTLSNERFQAIQKEAPLDKQGYLVQVTKYQGAQHCKTWIVGKWISPGEQRWAPSGTHFHQFVVPPILKMRKDCTYGNLAAMRLPDDVQELSSCEYTMDRRIVHACHAGGVVHSLEGWDHHEVGAIEVDKIDVVWNAALKNGLTPV